MSSYSTDVPAITVNDYRYSNADASHAKSLGVKNGICRDGGEEDTFFNILTAKNVTLSARPDV